MNDPTQALDHPMPSGRTPDMESCDHIAALAPSARIGRSVLAVQMVLLTTGSCGRERAFENARPSRIGEFVRAAGGRREFLITE